MSFSCLSGYDPSGVTLESSIMSKFAIHGSIPQVQSAIATKLRQPDVTAQAAAVNTLGAATDQMASTLASISSGVNIQV